MQVVFKIYEKMHFVLPLVSSALGPRTSALTGTV